MHYIAVYRREDDPAMIGMPVAMFRDGALMGNWPKVADGVYNREYMTADVELDEGVVYSSAIDDAYEASAAPAAPTAEDVAYTQLVAEKRATLTREVMERAAEMQARQELADGGLLAPNVAYAETDGATYPSFADRLDRGELDRGEMVPSAIDSRPENADLGTPMDFPHLAPTPMESPTSAPVNPERNPAVAPITETSGGVVTDDESPAHRPTPPESTATVEPE